MADKTLISKYDGVHVTVGDRLVRVDKGGAVPDGADAGHVKLLVERKLLVEGEAVGGATGVDENAPPPFPLPDEADQPDKSRARRGSSSKDDAEQ